MCLLSSRTRHTIISGSWLKMLSSFVRTLYAPVHLLHLTIQEFEGVFTCTTDDTLDFLFETIRRARLHRFVIVDDNKRLVGMLTLSDILGYLIYGELGDQGLESKMG